MGIQMTKSELQFFGGQRKFRHNILRYIKAKELPYPPNKVWQAI